MEYNNKNLELFDKYLFARRKLNHIYNYPRKENKNTFYSFKYNNNNLNIPLIDKNNKSYNKSNKIGLHVPENELINLKREEAKRLFPNDYINENKRRLLNKKNNFQDNSNYFKIRNSFLFNFPQNNILDNYYLKQDIIHNYKTISNMKSENNNNLFYNLNENKIPKNKLFLDNNPKKVETIKELSPILKNKNNKKKENEIILPLNIENKGKNYITNDANGNFMEKYEYYLLNMNKNAKKRKIKKENKSEKINIYYSTFSNFIHENNNNNNKVIQEIKPYKFKKYNLNIDKSNNIKKGLLTSRNDTLPNCKYLTKYLDDSYTKKLFNKKKDDKPKSINKKLKKNHFDEVLNKMQRNILCINEKNEDVAKRGAVPLLFPENEKMNNEIDKNMNMICRIKNFSLKEESKELIPIINQIIISKKIMKNSGIQKSDIKNDLIKKNRSKFNLKDLKEFNLAENIKYGYKDAEGGQGIGNILYNLINKTSPRKSRFRGRIQIRYFSHLNYKTKLNIKSINVKKRYKSFDNKNNNENDSFYIPSHYNNRNKSNKNILRNKSKLGTSKTMDNNNASNIKENLQKLLEDNLFNKK